MLCMDANADLLDPMLQKLLTDNDLVDLVGTKLGSDLPETYARGTKTIDHIFGTAILATAVKRKDTIWRTTTNRRKSFT
eukprot:scaffold97_cov54-Attheya_sp.AAC.2